MITKTIPMKHETGGSFIHPFLQSNYRIRSEFQIHKIVACKAFRANVYKNRGQNHLFLCCDHIIFSKRSYNFQNFCKLSHSKLLHIYSIETM